MLVYYYDKRIYHLFHLKEEGRYLLVFDLLLDTGYCIVLLRF